MVVVTMNKIYVGLLSLVLALSIMAAASFAASTDTRQDEYGMCTKTTGSGKLMTQAVDQNAGGWSCQPAAPSCSVFGVTGMCGTLSTCSGGVFIETSLLDGQCGLNQGCCVTF